MGRQLITDSISIKWVVSSSNFNFVLPATLLNAADHMLLEATPPWWSCIDKLPGSAPAAQIPKSFWNTGEQQINLISLEAALKHFTLSES